MQKLKPRRSETKLNGTGYQFLKTTDFNAEENYDVSLKLVLYTVIDIKCMYVAIQNPRTNVY